MRTRRDFLSLAAKAGVSLPAVAAAGRQARAEDAGVSVNDIHSQLNATHMARVVAPGSEDQLRSELKAARAEGKPVSIAGGRHAMGGQQFARDGVLIDTRAMNRVLSLEEDRGRR